MLKVFQRLGAISSVNDFFFAGGLSVLVQISHYALSFHHLFSLTTWSLLTGQHPVCLLIQWRYPPPLSDAKSEDGKCKAC
jgi:hypothetical protein